MHICMYVCVPKYVTTYMYMYVSVCVHVYVCNYESI